MTWLSILFYFIFNLPKLISLIKQIIDLIGGMPKDQQVLWKGKLMHAIELHKQTGDDSEIQKVAQGIGVAPQLVKE